METENDDSADSMIGRVIANRYRIEKKLAEGGIGLVYLAADQRMMGRRVVVKLLLEAMTGRRDLLRKFEHEKEALSRLDHPGIVSILDSGTVDGGKPFFVMPFVEGRTLQQILARKVLLDWVSCADIIEAVTAALAAAHSKGVLHRDVKPANIMISALPNGKLRVLLIDFGIARVFESQISPVTEVGRPVGTILYIAPEQVDGSPVQTSAADIYSFGIVAYEMLTGRLPFEPKSMIDMVRLQRDGLEALPSDVRREIPRSIDHIIFKALAYDPSDRYQDAEEFGTALCKELRKQIDGNISIPPISQITRPKIVGIKVPAAPEMPDPNLLAGMNGNAGEDGEVSTLTREEALTKRREPEQVPMNHSADEVRRSRGIRDFLVPLAAAAVVLIVLGAALFGLLYYRFSERGRPDMSGTEQPPPAVQAASAKGVQLFLLAKPVGKRESSAQPYRTDASEVFTKNIGLALNVTAETDGFLYLFSEADSEPGVFNILFPTEKQHKGDPMMNAGEQFQTDFNEFDGPSGKDTVWLVWTKDLRPELEAARRDAVANEYVTNKAALLGLQNFLQRQSSTGPDETKDAADKRITLRPRQDVIVYPIELDHR